MEYILQVTRDIYVLQHITVGLWRRSGSNGEGRNKMLITFESQSSFCLNVFVLEIVVLVGQRN